MRTSALWGLTRGAVHEVFNRWAADQDEEGECVPVRYEQTG